jgi:serine/threonine protein kinase/tetratricopeptide (TPR) repeat protein
MPADLQKVRELFLHAVGKLPPEEWAGYVGEACGGDAELEQQVGHLLQVHREAGSFLDRPAAAVGGTGTYPVGPGTEAAVAPLRERPGTVIGPYKLLQQIGEGGMGTVFMAEQTRPVQRKVALKVIKAGMDSAQVIARFEAERQALAVMDHVNIARVFDGGTTETGRPYFVMELVHGVPITRYCDDNHLTPRERLELFVPVCQAIQHAHQKGVIHRDVKPSNVMVTLYDGKPVPKVIDFGMAKATEQKLTERTLFTQYGTLVGTLEYMSPEQAEMSGLGVDTRSDVYSLGVLLYELLTGSTPLSHKRVREAAYREVLRMIREEEPPRPSTRLSDSGDTLASISAQRHMEPAKLAKLMRGELDWIVMKTLEKDRNRRYETASSIAADVQRYLNDEPVQACPPTAGYRLRKFVWRNKATLATVLIAMIAALFVVGSVGWAVRDRAARNAALDYEVRRTLDEAAAQLEGAKWPEALATVQRAEKLLAAGGHQEVPQRLRDLQKDLALAQRLENIYSRPRKEEFYVGYELDDAYAEAFADAGIDVAALPVLEAAERIRARGIWRELARALDVWAGMRQRAGSQKAPDWKRLLEIAEAADPDPWRNPLRQARRHGDGKALAALAASADVARLRPETLHLLGYALYDSGAKEQAVALMRQAQLRYPDDWWINNLMGWYCLTARPPQYDDALRYYTASQAVRPQNPYNLHAIGLGLLGKKAYAEAVVVYSRAIELKPDYSGAWFKRGEAYEHLGQGDKAAADVAHAIESNPKSAATWIDAGEAYDNLGRKDEAIAAFKEAIRLQPDSALAHYEFGRDLARKGLFDEAVAANKEVIRLQPEYVGGHFNLAWILSRKGDLDGAIPEWKEAIRLGPGYAESYYRLANVLANGADPKLRDAAEAVKLARKAVELAPRYDLYWQSLGWALYRADAWKDSIEAFHKSMELQEDPKGGDSYQWFGLAVAHWHLGNKEEARKWHDRAVQWMDKNDPKSDELRRFRAEAAELLGIKK